jgi:hypothetical protein
MDIQLLGAAPVRPTDTPTHTNTLGLTLTEGQLIRAIVQRNADSLVWLNIGGRTLAARSQLPLQEGQEVTLQVAEIGANRITLRPTLPADATVLSLTADTTAGLEALLTEWGLAADATNIALTRALLAQQGHVSRSDVQTLRSLWNWLSNSTAGSSLLSDVATAAPDHAAARALATLYANQLPITPTTLELARNWVAGPPQLAHSLAELENALTDVIGQLRAPGQHSLAAQELLAELDQAAQRAALWSVPLDSSATIVARRLPASLAAAGIPQDMMLSEYTDLAGLLQRAGRGEGPLTAADVQALLQAVGENESDNPGRWLQHLASKVHSFLGQLDAESRLTPSLLRLQGQIDRVATDLASIQLINTGHSSTVGADVATLFPLPMTTPDGPSTAYIKVYRRNGHGEIDPHNVRLALIFDLPELGEMTFNLSIAEQRLNGQILTHHDRTHHLVLEQLSELRDDLAQLGYQVEGLTCGKLVTSPARDETISATTSSHLINLKA